MKIFSATQMQQWDAYTITHEPITSIALMERAALACTNWLQEYLLSSQKPLHIFCGKGNNGGDGLAIARLLLTKGYQVSVHILEFGTMGTDDFQINLQRLHSLTKNISFIQEGTSLPIVENNAVVIDALFGAGLNRPLQQVAQHLVQYINQHAKIIVAIDVPSGMYIDKSCKENTIIKAQYTLTFQQKKLCFFAAENAPYFGEVIVLPIGLHDAFLQATTTKYQTLEGNEVAAILHPVNEFAHKGNFGHSLIIAGNHGTMGAAILSAQACLRSGTGLLTTGVPAEGVMMMQIAVPEAMCLVRETNTLAYTKYAAIGVGPGLGTTDASKKMLQSVLQDATQPLVLDADALNCISLPDTDYSLHNIPPNAIITPHPKEFDRLFGSHNSEFERWEKAIAITEQYSFVLVLKGHHTLIAYNGKGWLNTTGNAGMAKGGSGDVLTGMLTALLAQGYSLLQAALLGVYLHGLAGDIVRTKLAPQSMRASDLIANIGNAFKEITKEDV